MFTDNLVERTLMGRELLDVLLGDFASSLRNRFVDDCGIDFISIGLFSLSGGTPENADSDSSVAGGSIRDGYQLVAANRIVVEAPPNTIFENRHELLKFVLLEPDARRGVES